MQVRIKKLDPKATVPTYGSEFSAGADLYACAEEAVLIPAGETRMIHTGLAFEIPEGYVGLIYARSSLGTKRGLAPANKVGVKPGERIAQMVIAPFLKAEFEVAEDLSDTVRGAGGFGSTGTK